MFKLKKLPTITAEAAAAAGDRVLLIDVRERHEWDAGHASVAVNAPLSELDKLIDHFPTDRPIVVVCRSGRRSTEATTRFRRKGFNASNLEGGMAAWVTSGLLIVGAESPARIV